jgi:hypothetical protein
MKTIVLTAAVIATMLGLTSTEAMAIRFMNPDSVDQHKGMVIIGQGKAGGVRVGAQQAEQLAQIYSTDVQTAQTVQTDVVSPSPGVLNSIRTFVISAFDIWN